MDYGLFLPCVEFGVGVLSSKMSWLGMRFDGKERIKGRSFLLRYLGD